MRTITSDKTIHGRDGVAYTLTGYEHSICDNCASEFVLSAQAKHNDRLMADARRRQKDYLTSDRIKSIRNRLNLNQQDASLVFGGGPNSFSKYERGTVTQSAAMDKLIRVAERFPIVAEYLISLSGLKAPLQKTNVTPFTPIREVMYLAYEDVLISESDGHRPIKERISGNWGHVPTSTGYRQKSVVNG